MCDSFLKNEKASMNLPKCIFDHRLRQTTGKVLCCTPYVQSSISYFIQYVAIGRSLRHPAKTSSKAKCIQNVVGWVPWSHCLAKTVTAGKWMLSFRPWRMDNSVAVFIQRYMNIFQVTYMYIIYEVRTCTRYSFDIDGLLWLYAERHSCMCQ